MSSENDVKKTPVWLIIGIVLALAGVIVSGITVDHHLRLEAHGSTEDGCNINATFSCDDVARSPYSKAFGTPLGVWGIGYFLGLIILLGGTLLGKSPTDNQHGYATLVLIGFITSLALAIISSVSVGAYCINCMIIYGICLAQAGLLFFAWKHIPKGMTQKTISNGCLNAAIAVAVIVAGYTFAKPNWDVDQGDRPAELSQEQIEKIKSRVAQASDPIPVNKSAYSGLGEDFRMGNDDAKAVIVEFADFECPSCANMATVLKEVYASYKDRALFVFKNYPLDTKCNDSLSQQIHKNACDFAILARCAGIYGKFWPYHDLVFSEIRNRAKPNPKVLARKIDLTADQIDSCLKSDDIINKIKDDIAIANGLNVTGTPTLFINGQRFQGRYSAPSISQYLDAVLEN